MSMVWAIWYDLPAEKRADYLKWVHDNHLPALKRRPGYAWAAHYESEGGGAEVRRVRDEILTRPKEDVGSGSQFLQLVGAQNPHTFFNPSVLTTESEGGAETQKMLAFRQGVRKAVFTEQVRVDGPAIKRADPDDLPAPAIQMGSFQVRSLEEEFDLNCWYSQYRLPYMAKAPGCVRTRKFTCPAGWAKHAILYEFTSLADRMKYFEEPHESLGLDPKEWTGRIARYTIHAPGSPMVGRRLWPPVEDASST